MATASFVLRPIFPFMIASILLSGCGLFDRPEGKSFISVGNRDISEEELNRKIQLVIFEMGITDNEVDQGIRAIISKIVEKTLIKEYGKEAGITISDQELESEIKKIKDDYSEDIFQDMLLRRYIEYDEWKDNIEELLLIKKIITKAMESIPPITTGEITDYFESHMDKFRHPQMVQLMQIVVDSRENAEKILDLLKKGHSMKELAEEFSLTPEAKNGGKLGWIEKGELDDYIEKVIFSMPTGLVSDIVKSPYGFHIFKVLARRDEGFNELPEVMEEIRSSMMLEKKDIFYRDWIAELKDRFPVSINPEVYKNWKIEGPA